MEDTLQSAPPHPAPETIRFEFKTRPGLLKLTIVNALLGLVTLGIYRFWGKTNIRKHIWSSVHINGEPLEYTGTGRELFMGFLVVFGVILLPIGLLSAAVFIALGPESAWLTIIQFAVILFAYVFWGYAIYKARKYQLTRTNWRGIRGNLVGSAMTYSLTYFGSMLASGMSLGWATPVMNTVLQEQIISDMRFGDAAFKFKGRAAPLYPTYAACWFLTIAAVIASIWALSSGFDYFSEMMEKLALGTELDGTAVITLFITIATAFVIVLLFYPMLWAIYSAKELRTFAQYTRFDGSPFTLAITTGSLQWFTIVNALIMILTLGFGKPFVQRRLVRFAIDRLALHGMIDVNRIQQSQASVDQRGEGLADAFDVGGL